MIDALAARVRRSSLGAKLGALGALVTAAVVLVALLALGAEVRANTRLVFAQQLARNERTIRELQQREAEQLLLAASVIVQAPRFEAALSTYQLEHNSGAPGTAFVRTATDELENSLRQVDADLLVATDDSGRVLAGAARRGMGVANGTSLLALPAVRHALDPRAPADSGALAVLRTETGYAQVAVYPIVQSGFTLGALVLGRRIDAGFAASQRAMADADIVVTAGRETIAASDSSAALAQLGPALDAHAGGPAATIQIADSEYVAAPVLLGETQDRVPVRLWMLQPLSRRVAALVEPLRRRFLLYGALAVLVAAFGAAFVARTVLRPFRRFVEYMRSGPAIEHRQSRFDATNEAREVRTLNDSFNQLMDSLANSQAQLRQSQKLEAIGTLAGGIAHDFNNLITVISGYTQLALLRANRNSPEADDLRQVIDASDRAAKLTHQLLAFSRKQVMQPTVLDLGEVVSAIVPMLRRIIGEHIVLDIDAGTPLSRIRADRGQLEQVLLNLAVNARDAMPGGGRLTIGTRNARDGHAVLLTVRDTGTGMADDVRERIFEPFFTTKELGKGTGLGLSMVHGIVNQSGGSIAVESALGQGTTFTITLPAVEVIAAGDDAQPDAEELPGGTETVLVVEDAEDVRVLACRTLEERGYTVLVASNAREALDIAASRRVDLLLTDIVMPHTSGPQLVSRYPASQPAPRVVYMSGYADDALAQYELDPRIVFLRKPFTPSLLLRTVRDALSGAAVATLVAMLVAATIAAATPSRAAAQGGVLLQGIVDAEGWSTNATSNLLTRNGGKPAGAGRIQLWGAVEPLPSLVLYGQTEREFGPASTYAGSDVYTDQFGARYVFSPAFVVDAGRFAPLVGTFAARHFSTRNPLIGEPDGYTTDYPLGVKVTGERARFDYRAGLVSLPVSHVGYQPSATPRLRPAVGGGYTPFTGFRIGGSFTAGSYLNDATPAAALAGESWSDYHQRIAAADLEIARGYLETHFEAARGAYDVPGRASAIVGYTYYGEAKYTLSPRFFVATRLERNKYPFIRQGVTAWTARLTDFVDGEVGAGYRAAANTVVKASYRADRWWVRPGTGFRGEGGHALALQVSQAFDVVDAWDKVRQR